MVTYADLQPLVVAVITSCGIIILACAVAFRGYVNLRNDNASLRLRAEKLEIDHADRDSKVATRWQELMQSTFGQFMQDVREQRQAIDDLRTEVGIQKALNLQKDNLILQLQGSQRTNIANIKEMTTKISRLETAELERDKLKHRVDELTQLVEDNEQRSQERHTKMNEITATNFELNAQLQLTIAERDMLQRQLSECESRIVLAEMQAIGEYYFKQQHPELYFSDQYFSDQYFGVVKIDAVQLLP